MAKIHRATVTQADLNYVGSITVDQELFGTKRHPAFPVRDRYQFTNGVFWQTYAIAGKRGQGEICLNGPRHHFKPGDKVIILAEAWIEPEELKDLNPIVVFVDEKNKVTEVKRHKLLPVESDDHH